MFQIDSMSRKPVYEQIIEQVESFLLNDVLKPGDQIPSVRNVTMQHAINPRTVLKAYNDLALEGVPLAAIQDCVNKAYAPKKEETS